MSGPTQGAGANPRDRIAFAVVLIVVGTAGLFLQVAQPTTDIGGWVVAIIGVALLAAFAVTRAYGYLVPGGILTGLGTGIVASQAFTLPTDEAMGGVIVLGLGLGFLSIWLIGGLAHVPEHHWWPFIPGGILTTVGAALLIGGQAIDLLDYWWIVLIAAGLIVLWRAWADTRAHT